MYVCQASLLYEYQRLKLGSPVAPAAAAAEPAPPLRAIITRLYAKAPAASTENMLTTARRKATGREMPLFRRNSEKSYSRLLTTRPGCCDMCASMASQGPFPIAFWAASLPTSLALTIFAWWAGNESDDSAREQNPEDDTERYSIADTHASAPTAFVAANDALANSLCMLSESGVNSLGFPNSVQSPMGVFFGSRSVALVSFSN
mmetsp:Transcript_31559/g.43937  ORF Transcript_31559/g.43937 Transcript_31559/m.43937 type:complete len:204 (-) Transcript_31559:352-963(-)